MNTIALEDIGTVFASEFAKKVKKIGLDKFIKMNYARRRKFVEVIITEMEKESIKNGQD